ncbi:hypothetical protein [Lusitaniella coriacea]|uniref:hypothetical protein n=1 Tax=Lusitaniella coriacea TaxID=1983105 RepID=UPI003CF91C18
MPKLTFFGISASDLKPLIHLEERAIANYPWTQVETLSLSEIEQQQLQVIVSRLLIVGHSFEQKLKKSIQRENN